MFDSSVIIECLYHEISAGDRMRIAHTVVTNTLQNTPREKSKSPGFFQKKKPSRNESIQSKVRSLEKLPAIVLSQARMMKPKGEEK